MLYSCERSWGAAHVEAGLLDVVECRDTLFVPLSDQCYYTGDSAWGIYDKAGQLVEAAALRIGVDAELLGQAPTSLTSRSAAALGPAPSYIYGGVFNPHYGHFICTTVSRLWPSLRHNQDRPKILFHSHQSPGYMFDLPHVKVCFEALGIFKEDVVWFREPTIVDRLLVPLPSFREQNSVNRVFRDLGLRVASSLGLKAENDYKPPVYLSKSKLSLGVGKYRNEEVFERSMERLGAEIVYPELMSLADQVRLFSQKRVIVGTISSAFHTSLFSGVNAELICLSGNDLVNTNFILIDKARGVDATYVYPSYGMQAESGVDGFLTTIDLNEPERVGEELAALVASVDARLASEGAPRSFSRLSTPVPPAVADDDVGSAPEDKLAFATRNTMKAEMAAHGWRIGPHTYGTPNVLEATYGPLTIGSFCSIAANVTIVLGNHRVDTVSTYPFRSLFGLWPGAELVDSDHDGRGGVEIGSDVWIGFGAVILPGARIGHGCVIGANAVVGGIIPDYAIVTGNPGRVSRKRFDDQTISRFLAVAWWDWDEARVMRAIPFLASGNPHRFLERMESGEA